jgi:glutamate synthase (NADPH/NADH) small chain
MDQRALRELENRCIQEEPPWCTAACPLHVDARALAGHIGQGRWADAWKVLRRHMPLPGILGRVCDAPCEGRCKRSDAGGSIRIGALERACVQTEPPAVRVLPLPSKNKSVAVAGGAMSSLTVAWDLVRKGYDVTVFEAGEVPGASLKKYDAMRLPAEAVDAEIAVLQQLGVGFETGCDPETAAIAARCMNSFDAVYLGLDAVGGRAWNLECDADGLVRVDAAIQSTSREGVFAGGRNPSPVWQAAQGRWAATSMDRFLQGVSITAGREKERPYETRLYTSLVDAVPLAAVPMADDNRGYSSSEAMEEARRCLQCDCRECVKVCAYLERFGAYPKKYAREVYNNLSIVMGEHKANRLINSCSLCGLCEQVCPNDFAMQDLCLEARRKMVDSGKMPPSAHEFALLDMEFSLSERFALARHQPGCETSRHLFFPGCQLCASAPQQVELVYAHLRSYLEGGVGLLLGCCAAPAHWAGRREAFEANTARIHSQWQSMGRPRMILACSTCMQIFKEHLPAIPTVSLWSILEDHLKKPPGFKDDTPLAIHDPCTSRFNVELQACVRRILSGTGFEIRELTLGREKTECCGFGGLMQNANPDLAREVAQGRAGRSTYDYVTYCAMCRDNLAVSGKRVIHLLDLFFPHPQYPDPAERPRPVWTLRRENRARLKAHLSAHLWNEECIMETSACQSMKLEISPQVAESLDRRRILVEDLQQVIQHAETSGERLFNPSNGRYKAAYAPYTVTFWVEYAPSGEGFVIHNAYSHRMEVLGP